MTKKQVNKQTERSMRLAVISTALCVIMLVGMTFAWFTATVESDKNVIKTANFAVQVLWSDDNSTIYATSEEALNNGWHNLDHTQPFNEENFCPGSEAIRYIAMYNQSTVDVKFDISLRAIAPEENTTADELLSKLEVYTKTDVEDSVVVVPDMYKNGTAASLQNNNDQALTQVSSSIVEKTTAPAEKVSVTAIAVKLPENYVYQTSQTINFYIKVIASQWDVEHAEATPVTGEALTIALKDVTVTVPADVADSSDKYELTVDDTGTKTNVTTSTVTHSYDINLFKNGTPISTAEGNTEYTVTIDVGQNAIITGVRHKGVAVTNYTYDPSSGILTFTTGSFSPFEIDVLEENVTATIIKSGENSYNDLKEALEAGGYVQLSCDIVMDVQKYITIPAGVTSTLDLNGYTLHINQPDATTGALITNNGNLTIEDSKGTGLLLAGSSTSDGASIPGYANNTITNLGTLTVNNGTIRNSGDGYACFAIDNMSNNGKNVSLTINGGRIVTDYSMSLRQAVFTNTTNDVVINGGVVGSYWIQNYGNSTKSAVGTLTINNVEALYGYRFDLGYSIDNGYNIKADEIIVEINGGSFKSITAYYWKNGNTEFIKGGSFTSDVSDYCAAGYFSKEIDGAYVVIPVSQATAEDYVAYVGETGYLSFEQAKAVSNNQPIKLNKDISGYLMFNDGETYTLDMNGHNIENYEGSGNTDTINVYKNTSLTITDTSTGTKGTISSAVGVAIWTGDSADDTSTIVIDGGVNLVGYTYCIQSDEGQTTIIINDATTNLDNSINEGSTLTDNRQGA